MHSCKRCLIPENFPGITLNEDGACNLCSNSLSIDEIREKKALLKSQLNLVIENVKGKAEYDCIVAFSGGKDSTYTLKLLVEEYGLNCLAIMIDNGFISSTSFSNGRIVTSQLGIDYQVFSPNQKFLFNMYRQSVKDKKVHSPSSIKRASAICNSCINLINSYMIKTALEKNIPMIAGGYIGGQVPSGSAFLDLSLLWLEKTKKSTLSHYENVFGIHASQYFGFPPMVLKNYDFESIKVINPMLTISVSEDEIISVINKVGWEKPLDTGIHSSNCKLNDLGVAIHYKKHGFNPYVLEICEQVRDGLMTKERALKKLNSIPSFEDVEEIAQKAGISKSDF